MAGNSILVINAAGAETRVALVESGTIHEYYLERKREQGIVGNIYKGRVVRVLPGMQAAFVDIGLEKAAFLYVGDVYGDPDFSEEFELTEGEHRAEVPEVPTEEEAEQAEERARLVVAEPPAPTAAGEGAPASEGAPAPVSEGAPAPVSEVAAAAVPAEGAVATEPSAAQAASVAAPEAAAPAGEAELPPPLTPIPLTRAVGMEPVPAVPGLPVPQLADAASTATSEVASQPAAAPAEAPAAAVEPSTAAAETAATPAEPSVAVAPAPEVAPEKDRIQAPGRESAREARGDREREGRRREERGRREGRERGERDRGGRNGHRDEKRSKEPKNIQDLLKEGQEVIVQVAKDPIGTKGARITSHISLPGRHLVFMPTVDHIGISRRIEKDGERRRLREIVDRMRPEGTGFIVRTVAENVEAAKLEADIRFLIQVWNEIIRTKDKVSAPALLHGDLDLILRATRDLFTADVGKLVIDDQDEYERILRFVREQAPHLESQIEYYAEKEPIFDAYGIEQELKRASQRKVWLKSGGYLIIDQAEALTAIDVNSGRYVGKKNLEETITKINVEAAKEIVYQLRLRNIGGIIIIDFIDMDKAQNREKVFKALQDALGRDKAKTNVLKISELGLVEMTRKRVRESVTRMMMEPCSYCEGKGHVKSKITVAYEIFREIRREAPHFPEPVLVVNCHPEVARILQNTERDELRYLMDRFNKTIQVKTQNGYHQEQFDIYGRQERAEQGGGGGGNRERRGRERRGDRGGGQDRNRGGVEQAAPATSGGANAAADPAASSAGSGGEKA
ncbi:Rne/Rng family ribonuclease [Anaeromyxobacter oryzisoli]|uniref:Rne/Rng family ribonuclease n=1 Tax=Anaeromyxobacter oryzisoli TaxID=2925408 RepID=UPI001F5A56C5|nr:Rne/Rng family ribonuclease [Anaeromyxobacter sp. SG63]